MAAEKKLYIEDLETQVLTVDQTIHLENVLVDTLAVGTLNVVEGTFDDVTVTNSLTYPGKVTGGANVGGGAAVYRDTTAGVLNMRTLVPGAGMTVTQVGDTIEFISSAVAPTNPAIGAGATAVPGGAAYGVNTTAGAYGSTALGTGATASGLNSTALGAGALAALPGTINLAGLVITRKGAGSLPVNAGIAWTGAVATFATQVIDLTAAPAQYDLPIPATAQFHPTGLTVLGITAAPSPATLVFENEGGGGIYGSLSNGGVTREVVALKSSTSAAAALRVRVSTASGPGGACRVVWRGILVQDE